MNLLVGRDMLVPETGKDDYPMQDDCSGVEPFDRDQVLPALAPWSRMGTIILMGTVLVGGLLGTLLKIHIQVKAPGEIRPDQEVQIVQARLEGTIARIEVSENETVKVGQAIAYLNTPDLPALENQSQAAQVELHQTMIQHEALMAQLDALNYKILTDGRALSSTDLNEEPQVALEEALALLMRNNPTLANHYLQQYEQVQRDRERVDQQLRDRQQQVTQLQHQIEQRVLMAPTEGTILRLTVHNPGQTVQPGMEIARIIPANADLIVKASVAVHDIGRVEVGQGVQMQVSAYPYPDYGILQGRVQAIAPDATPCEHSRCPSPMIYQVIIQPQQDALQRGDRTYRLQPGMEVDASIISHRQRLISFLFHKLRLGTQI